MKKLLLILICLFVSSPSKGEWVFSWMNDILMSYIDFETIRSDGEYRYYNSVINLIEPLGDGTECISAERKVDCEVLSTMITKSFSHKLDFCKGDGRDLQKDKPYLLRWEYPPPGSYGEVELEKVCNYKIKK